jgi:ribonucleoside-diphosphate reductase beta chain
MLDRSRIFSQAINWNKVEDPLDLQVYDTLQSNFWLPEKISLSSDLAAWRRMSPAEHEVTGKIFTGLTCLDHLQATVGSLSLIEDARTAHEAAVYTVISMQETNHAKSYSSIFSTLFDSPQIDRFFEWVKDDSHMNKKIDIYNDYYAGENEYHKKIASTSLESFSFYSGFFWPFYNSSRGRLTATANLVSLIVADEAIHGAYVGAKYQSSIRDLTEGERSELAEYTVSLLLDLMENEERYVEDIYDPLGGDVTSQVKRFLKYNANRTLQNLGYDNLYTPDQTKTGAEIISALNNTNGNHDFFSSGGASYKLLKAEELTDDEWAF